MHRNKRQFRGATILLTLSVAVLVFTASTAPAHAQFATISSTIADVPRTLFQIFDRIKQAVGSRAFHQAVRSVTYRLAQDSAVWLASGDKGKKPLVFRQPLGDALTDIGDQIAGKFLVNVSQGLPINLCSPASVQSRLKLVVGVSKSIQDIDLFPDRVCPPGQVPAARGCVSADLGQTGCSLTDITGNFSQAIGNQRQALKNLSKGFDIDRNELGAFLVLRENVKKEKQKQIEQEKIERAGEAPKAVKDLITGVTLTPAFQVTETQKQATEKALEQDVQPTGDILADAAAIFANTFAQTYLRRLQQGLLRGSTARTGGRGPGGLGSTAAPRGKLALLQDFAEFSPARALDISSGSLNLIADMSICPSSEDRSVFQSPYHCLLSTDFKQAVEQKLTVRQAVEQNLIPADAQFPQDPVANQPNFSKENLKRLRFLRVIPLGWELAAERLGSQRVPFRTLLDCFEDPSDPTNRTLPRNCPKTAPGGAGENLLYHLVDPAWVLALPQTECRALAYGSLPEYSGSPTRQSTCVDLASCISEDSNGNCSGYGYCTRERVTWQLSGSSCEPQYATCQSFTSPRNLSLLTAYVDNAGCSAQTAGCKWYSTQSTGADTWNPDQKIYLNSKAQSCSSSQAESKEVIPLVVGVNYVKNPGFDEELFASRPSGIGSIGTPATPAPEEGGWNLNGQLIEQAYIAGTGAIAPIDASQTTTIKPFTYYTLSFFAYPNPNDPTINEARAEVAASGGLRSVSFPDYSFSEGPSLTLVVPDVGPRPSSRFAATFYNANNTATEITVSLKDEVLYDNIQLEEVSLQQGANAIAAVAAATQKDVATLNTVPGQGSINVASPTTKYKAYGTENKSVFTNAGECDAAEETSARKYTPTAGGSAVYARLSAGGLCSASCNGFDTLLSMPTSIEKLADPNRRAEQVRFIPDLAKSCTLEQVGCEVFTNVATEGREYYNRIESCVLDANLNIATFFTWEAGQLKVWQLLADRNSSGPCTSFPQGGRAGVIDPATSSCQDPDGGSPTCSDDEQGALCRTFLDENGVEHKRDANKVVTASSQCTQFRRTAEVSGVQESWYFVPSEANQCSATAVGCREYKGTAANVVQQVYIEDFENGAGGWINGALSDQSVDQTGVSYRISAGEGNDIVRPIPLANPLNKTYEITFKAKAANDETAGTFDLLRLRTEVDGVQQNRYFLSTSDRAIAVSDNWAEYKAGPLFYQPYGGEYDTQNPGLYIRAQGSDIVIDDIEITEVRDTYYRIQNSTLPQREGGNQPNACYDADIRSCKQYRDDKNNTYYVSRFDKLFASERSLTCTAVIDTQNSDSPYSQAFEVGEKERPSGPPVPDWYAVPADQISYLYIDPANKVADSAAGCTALGQPPTGTLADGQPVENWTTAHKRIDPDEFLGANGTLCNQQGLWCEAFTASKGGTYYFRDPGDKLCDWNPDALGTEFGGFVDANSNLCDIDEGYVPQCPGEADSCTAYQPTSNEYSEAGATTLFRLANQVSTGDCSGVASTDLGCVEFKKDYFTTETPSSQYSPDTVPRSKFLTGASQNRAVYEVSQSRQCAEWLAPTTTSVAEAPTTKLSRAITYDLGRCQQMVNNTCVKWVTPADDGYPDAYKDGSSPAVFNPAAYRDRYIVDGQQKTIYSGAWDYSGYSLPNQYPVELLREAQQGGRTVLAYGAVAPAADALECRGYPEQDSPFDGTSKVVFPTDANSNFLYSDGITYNDQRFKNFNVCWEDGGACECAYKKVEALDQTVYLSRASQRNLPESTRQITSYDGWYGYCLERASGIKDPRDKEACLAWWPVDVVQGKPNIFENHPEAGFVSSQPLYYCLEAKGNKLPQVGADKVSFRDNNYVFDFDKNWKDYFVLGDNNTEVLVRYNESGGVYAWPDASGIVKSQVDFENTRSNPSNPFANLYEYDIESIILKPFGAPKSYPEGVDFVLNREGFAKGSVGKSTIFDKEASDRWSIFWCGGGDNNQCDKVFGDKYTWEKFSPIISDIDSCKNGVDSAFGSTSATNLFAARAVFADENGNVSSDSSFYIDVQKKNPYQFIGFEGGLCDNSGGAAYVQFKVALQLREWCSDVALVSSAGGENKAWTGRLNNMGQQSSGLCQGGINNKNLCFSDSDCSGGDSCNYKFDMLRDGSGKIIGGNLTGLYNVMSGEFPVPFPFNISQDNKPFGAVAPPPDAIYNPANWDSKPDEIEDEFTGEMRDGEPGRQPLYVEAPKDQVRAGSPYACSSSADKCLFPPSKDGKLPTSWVPDQALQSLKHPLEFLNQIFAKVYKIWRWSSSVADMGYGIIAGGDAKQDPSTITSIEGQCPVIQAVERNEQGYVAASGQANSPELGNCSDNNFGRYSINGTPVAHSGEGKAPGEPNTPITNVSVGEEMKLEFYGFNFNGEQLPIRKITIDWTGENIEDVDVARNRGFGFKPEADQSEVTIITGNFKNHRPDCGDNEPNYGQSSRACENAPFAFTHRYLRAGQFFPIVILEDNWGKQTRASYNPSTPVLDIQHLNLSIKPPANLSVSSSNPNQGNAVTLTWGLPPVETGKPPPEIVNFKISLTRNTLAGTMPREFRTTGATTVSYVEPGDASLKSFAFDVAACTNEACGQSASRTVVFRPNAVSGISVSPNPPIIGLPLAISWDANELADRYEIELDQKDGVADSSAVIEAPGTQWTYLYQSPTAHVRIRVRPCNGTVCGSYGFTVPERLVYKEDIAIVSGAGNVSVDTGTALSRSIVLNKSSGYTYSFTPALSGSGWISASQSDSAVTLSGTPTLGNVGSATYYFSAHHTDTDSTAEGSVTITVNSTCGNGVVQPAAGELCDPNDPAIANYSVTGASGGNSVTKRCVPAGQTIGGRGECRWWPDADGDGMDGQLDCQNQTREAYMYIGSTYKSTSRMDYNCNNNIDEEQGGCTRTSGQAACAASSPCPGFGTNPTSVIVCPNNPERAQQFCNAWKAGESGWEPDIVCPSQPPGVVECRKCIEFGPSQFY